MGYYHDENFNEEIMKEKKRLYEQPKNTKTTSHRENSRIESSVESDKLNKYLENASALVSTTNGFQSISGHSLKFKHVSGMSNSSG